MNSVSALCPRKLSPPKSQLGWNWGPWGPPFATELLMIFWENVLAMNRFWERGQDTVTSCGLTSEPTMSHRGPRLNSAGHYIKQPVMNVGKRFVRKKGAGSGLAGKQK